MQLVLEIKNVRDLEILLPLLKRLGIVVKQSGKNSDINSNNKAPLSDFWGKSPSIDVKAFDDYLQQTRDEWENPIS